MSSNPIRLQYLFNRYVSNASSAEELAEFWLLMGELSDNDIVTEDIRRLWEAKKSSRYASDDVDWDSLYREMMDKGRRIEINYETVHGRRTHRWARIAAAACILGAVATGSIYLMKSRAKTPAVLASGAVDDVMPGKSGAILTLGNGRQVILDSSGNGLVAMQDGTRIELERGKLAYHTDKQAAATTYNTMTTPTGRKYQLVLSDGTIVWLNAASSISYPATFPTGGRKVSITGEAYFEVAKDPKKPFFVDVSGMTVEVLGTSFDVNAYSDEDVIRTTLLNGSVMVRKGRSRQLLVPGQQARLYKDDRLGLVATADTAIELAWKNDEFYFRNADLQTVMRQLARWYDLEIVYEKGAPLNRHFEGEITMNTMLSEVLEVLEKNDIRFRLQGKKLTVLP